MRELSLRARLLAAIFFVNLVVLGALSYLLYGQNEASLHRAARSFEKEQGRELLSSFAERLGKEVTIRETIGFSGFERICKDVLITDNPIVSDPEAVGVAEARHAYIQINPLGAMHRDPETFPIDAIMGGIRRAMDTREAVAMHGGFCMPIETASKRLIGGGWFLPFGAVEVESLPIQNLLLAIGLGVVLLGGITFVGIESWILRPLARLSGAAGQLETGVTDMLAQGSSGSKEVDRVFAAFDRASRLIASHRKELEEAVEVATDRARRRERELVLSQRLAALGTLAAGIAHEINNPLAGLLNASRRLRKAKTEDKKLLYLEMIEEGLERIRKIVRRTLDFAPRTTEALTFPVPGAVQRAHALIEHRLEREGVRFEEEGDPGISVRGDLHELSQVFLNLFLNSLDALSESETREPRILVRYGITENGDGRQALIEIEDNGPGADAATLEHIFDPFYSTKGVTSQSEKISSGLGMSISYTIIEQHGGNLSVASPAAGGFHVRIRLPLAQRGEDASEEARDR